MFFANAASSEFKMQRLSFELLGSFSSGKLLKPGTVDLRTFMFESARHRRHLLPAKIATITGSAGKTTVKEILGHLLEGAFISPANQNTKLALALQILRLPATPITAIFEMGARRLGDFQTPLSYVRPEVVTLLNIGSAHVGEFGSPENLLREKLSPLEFESVRTLVVPADDARIVKHAREQGKNLITFGSDATADVELIRESSEGVYLKVRKESVFIECPFRGPKKGLNIAAAIATVLALGVSVHNVARRLTDFRGVERRFQAFNWQSRLAIDDAFNASPESMREGLRHLLTQTKNMKILLVLGTMLELGASSEKEHRELGYDIKTMFGEAIATQRLTLVTVGAEAAFISENHATGLPPEQLYHFATATEAKATVESLAKQADVIYFKASKGIQLNQIFSS
jgi:UDP-N-acetylmuramoyl-tripeptide--D-alanyl-D-alanine ligase